MQPEWFLDLLNRRDVEKQVDYDPVLEAIVHKFTHELWEYTIIQYTG